MNENQDVSRHFQRLSAEVREAEKAMAGRFTATPAPDAGAAEADQIPLHAESVRRSGPKRDPGCADWWQLPPHCCWRQASIH